MIGIRQLDRTRVRQLAAAAALAMAAIYYLIGLRVLDIGGSSSGEMVDLTVFGGGAGTAFLALGLLLLATDRRWLWALAALMQVWVYVIYFSVADGREPPFEVWGITLRIIQAPLLLALLYLAVRSPGKTGSLRS